jgi:hypothetical protein
VANIFVGRFAYVQAILSLYGGHHCRMYKRLRRDLRTGIAPIINRLTLDHSHLVCPVTIVHPCSAIRCQPLTNQLVETAYLVHSTVQLLSRRYLSERCCVRAIMDHRESTGTTVTWRQPGSPSGRKKIWYEYLTRQRLLQLVNAYSSSRIG